MVKETIEKTQLDTLRKIYKAGTKVTAIKVAGIPQGKVGYVKRVETNGDISLVWDSGEECTILYGKESVGAVTEGVCLIQNSPDRDNECAKSNCETCGWHRDVSERRMRQLRESGLTRGKDGLSRLIVRRENQ